MSLSERDIYLNNIKLKGSTYIPANIYISDATWDEHREELEKVALKYKEFFPYVYPGWRDYNNYEFADNQNKYKPYTDEWGCVWKTSVNGIIGAVVEHPLDDYSKLKDYKFPNVNQLMPNMEQYKKEIALRKSKGELTQAGLEHGHYFLRLQDLRGFNNFMMDILDDNEDFNFLANKVEEIQLTRINKFAKLDLDIFCFGEDLGTQTSTFISPQHFRKIIKPRYKRMMKPLIEHNTLIRFHCDGAVMDIVEDLLDCGVNIINIQDIVNDVKNIAKELKGRVCIQLDIDRQSILPYGTPKDVDDLVRHEIEILGSKQGGLELIAGIYPPTPVKNIEALCNAIRKYRRLPF